jgi:hypothetical protein
MCRSEITADQFFAETGDAYLALVHLDNGVDEAVAKISGVASGSSSQLIDDLLIGGDSWRERMTGLVMASLRGIEEHYDSLIKGFLRTGGISLVPMAAAISVAVRDRNCLYDPLAIDSLDRSSWDGETGFAVGWLHHTIGIGAAPDRNRGPNHGQDFAKHRDFYATFSSP